MSYFSTWSLHQDRLRHGDCPVALRTQGADVTWFGLAHVDLAWGVLFVRRGRWIKCRWDTDKLPFIDGHGKIESGIVTDAMYPIANLVWLDFLDPKVWTPYLEKDE